MQIILIPEGERNYAARIRKKENELEKNWLLVSPGYLFFLILYAFLF